MHDFCLTIPYGLLVLIGGLVGYVRKGSIMSLAGGVGTGLLLLLAGQISLKAFEKGRNSYFSIFLETVCSFALTWAMGQRYLITSKIMPAGIVAIIRFRSISIVVLPCLKASCGEPLRSETELNLTLAIQSDQNIFQPRLSHFWPRQNTFQSWKGYFNPLNL